VYIVAISVTFLSDKIVTALYGPLFTQASTILAIHVWAGLFVFMGVVRSLWILAEGYTKISLYTTVSGAALNIALNFYLIPGYGAIGAAAATVISYCFSDYVLFLLVPGLRRMGCIMTKALLLNFVWRRKANVR
jgi:PST family polysaccharide transporter